MNNPAPLAIRAAVERGWLAFSHCPWVLMGFTLVSGASNLVAQVWFRHESGRVLTELGQPDALAASLAAGAWMLYVATGLWMVVGLMRGSLLALDQAQPRFGDLSRLDARAMGRCLGTLALALLVLAVIMRLSQASAWLLTLLQPLLAPLPLLAGVAAGIYLSADQILSLPLSLIGGRNPVEAFQGSRAATDPHWLHALGLTLVLLAMVLAGFLVLVVGLVVALPVASCTLTAAYQQLFGTGHRALLKET